MSTQIRDVVMMVVGTAPEPPWLEPRLIQMAGTIRLYIEGEESAPKKIEMRARLEQFRSSVINIKDELTDHLFVSFLGSDWRSSPESYNNTISCLELLANKASTLSLEFTGRSGSSRAFPAGVDDAISSNELCAWTILQAMTASRNVKSVGADNTDAWAAMNVYFKFCGGQALGRIDATGSRGDPSGWREHIITVKNIAKEQSRLSIHLAEMARRFTALRPPPPLQNLDSRDN